MQIQFHGAVRTVTGSQHLLTINGRRLLLDCGLFQGRRKEMYQRNQSLPFDASQVDVCVLSHAHIDHSGNIPNLVKSGFRGDIVCTYATRDLCAIMLRDSGRIQESDVRHLNKRRQKQRQPPLEPIYTEVDAIRSMDYFLGVAYDRPRQILPGVMLTLIDAGHILGSAVVVLDIDDEETGRALRVVFSGDVGRPNRPILRDPQQVDGCDVMLVESTYGDREHRDNVAGSEQLRDVIARTAARGGKVIVPAFAVGRTQELVYRIHQLVLERALPNLAIYVDSPLAIDATGVYRLHPEGYDEELYQFMLNNRDPFGFARMIYTRTVEQSKALNEIDGPCVIISASGMAENGRILHHLRNNIEDARNTVLIVGWQAPHTLGRRIVERQPEVRIFGQPHKLRAEVAVINGFSAHADRSELLDWLGALRDRPSHTFIVHGDEDVSLAFAQTLRGHNYRNVSVPQLHETFTL